MISIIIVQYHVKEELLDCIQSIKDSKPKAICEIIVVDNDEKKTIKKDLLKRFPKVIYIPNTNKGFGQGNNVGVKYAKGEFLFFLNPDTIVFKETIDILVSFLKKNKKAGVVAPFLLHDDKNPFEQQGVKELTPMRAVFALSLLNKLFPNNPVSKKYFIQWDKLEIKEVDVVPGTAFMMTAELFKSLKGFDEKFFLYFEEFDLCKRIKQKGYKLFINPRVKIIHLWERSTKKRNDINKIFKESRFYYFKKHFGIIPAILTDIILNIGKNSLLFLLIFILAAFLLLYKLETYMPFIPDQAWFYLSARDIFVKGQIPLLGITSSHTWLHQGALWTYMLAGALWIGRFNPFSGAYLMTAISLITIWLIYKIGSEMFSVRVGLIASLFYATSPFILLSGRMPYHTGPIPLLTLLLFYCIYKWINGFSYGVPLIVLLLTLLYNFETATFMLVPLFILVLMYGFFKKTLWIKDLFRPKLLVSSAVIWFLVMVPMLVYDVHHGYPQTVKFLLWLGYKIATVFGYPKLQSHLKGEPIPAMIHFVSIRIQDLMFFYNKAIAWVLLGVCSFYSLYYSVRLFIKKQYKEEYYLLSLFFFIPAIGYFIERTNSNAYLVLFYPTIAFMFGVLFDHVMKWKKSFYPALGLLLIIVFSNILGFIQSNYLNYNNLTFVEQISQAKRIVSESHGQEYNLVGSGVDSQYINLTLNYEYLTWWLGHGQSDVKQPLRFIIEGTPDGVKIKKSMNGYIKNL